MTTENLRTTLFQQIPNITFRQLWILAALNKEKLIWKELRAMNNWNDGALYGALMVLERRELIKIRHVKILKREHQEYRITPEGRAILDAVYEEVFSWSKNNHPQVKP